MEIWPSAGTSGNETSLKDVSLTTTAMKCTEYLTLLLGLTVQWKFYILWAFTVIVLLLVREVFLSLSMMTLTCFFLNTLDGRISHYLFHVTVK